MDTRQRHETDRIVRVGAKRSCLLFFFFFYFSSSSFSMDSIVFFLLHRHVLDERSLKCGEVLLKCFSRPCFFFFVCYQGNVFGR